MTKKSFAVLALSLMLLAPWASADYLPVRAYANDTVAGYSTTLKSSVLAPGQDVVFVVEKPDLSVARVSAKAELDGIAKAELYGHLTKLAGTYQVALVYPGSAKASPQSAFSVYPDAVSITQSTLSAPRPLLSADGKDNGFLTVILYDAYRNPITGHSLKLISSRSDDAISALQAGVTDDFGRANFSVSSKYPGISVFSALDTTLNLILSDREEVVFQALAEVPSGIGGSILRANLLGADLGQGAPVAAAGPVDHFEIEGLPATVKVNEQQSVTVLAKDSNNNVAKNYTGTVLFAISEDENAVLPGNGEYTFKETDQGRFTFNLALQFSKLGKQTLQVFDKNNWNISGEWQAEVVSGQAVSSEGLSETRLTIKSPVDGAVLGSSFALLSGQGDPNINLKVFDNDAKIGDSETDGEGFFSFEARNLESGSHRFYVMSDQGAVSSEVGVQIDTLPPVLNTFQVFPAGSVRPGDTLSFILQSEPDLEEVKVRLGAAETILNEEDSGNYSGTLLAPSTEGSFGLDVILIDALANKAELLNQVSVKVAPPFVVTPPQVQGLGGEAGESSVALSWEPVTDHTAAIARYRIYYGTHFNELEEKAETEGPGAAFTLTGLTNDTQYFFTVKAVDEKGMESQEGSVTVALTPKTPPAAAAAPASASPESYQAFPMNGAVSLSWAPALGAQAFYYKVYFGVQSGKYDDYAVTPNQESRLIVSDLINDLPYYFRVVALDLAGREISSFSPEFTATPSALSLYPAAPALASPVSYNRQLGRVPSTEKTGSETLWIIGASLLLAHFFYLQKRRLLNR